MENLSKEILDDVAFELQVSPFKIRHLMDTKKENTIESIFYSMGTHYGVSKRKIVDAIREVFWLYANKGKAVIIGCGGAFITRKISSSLHIRLDAPLE